jgi:hypothetical protein
MNVERAIELQEQAWIHHRAAEAVELPHEHGIEAMLRGVGVVGAVAAESVKKVLETPRGTSQRRAWIEFRF